MAPAAMRANGSPVALYQRPLGLAEPWHDDRCGSYAGYNAHNLLGEAPCDPCKHARADYMREYRLRTGRTRGMQIPIAFQNWHPRP